MDIFWKKNIKAPIHKWAETVHRKLTHIFPSQMKITQFSVLMMKTTRIEAGFLNLGVIDILSLYFFLYFFLFPRYWGLSLGPTHASQTLYHWTIPLVFFSSTVKILRQGITKLLPQLVLNSF